MALMAVMVELMILEQFWVVVLEFFSLLVELLPSWVCLFFLVLAQAQVLQVPLQALGLLVLLPLLALRALVPLELLLPLLHPIPWAH